MVAGPNQPGADCQDCRKNGVFADARRTITDDQGCRRHLCLNHAAAVIHEHDLYDQAMNPKGKR